MTAAAAAEATVGAATEADTQGVQEDTEDPGTAAAAKLKNLSTAAPPCEDGDGDEPTGGNDDGSSDDTTGAGSEGRAVWAGKAGERGAGRGEKKRGGGGGSGDG